MVEVSELQHKIQEVFKKGMPPKGAEKKHFPEEESADSLVSPEFR
jgi:hypothetical protein